MQKINILRLLILCFIYLSISDIAWGQKQGRTTRDFPAQGISFRPLKDWLDVPVDERSRSVGIIAQLEAERPVSVKVEGNQRANWVCHLKVLQVFPESSTTESENSGGSLRGRVSTEKAAEKTGKDYVQLLFSQSIRKEEFKLVEPEISDPKIRKVESKREEIETFIVASNAGLDMLFDVYTIQLPDSKIIFVWDYPAEEKTRKKWSKEVLKSMKTLKVDLKAIEEANNKKEVDSDSDYTELLEFHQRDVDQTPGWRLVETPSKNYLIKTNSENKKHINNVIKRLEASRKLYEEDFPPSKPITNVSVVRICATQKEFSMYGNTSAGVAGYFNPRSEELVLYFDRNSGPDMTLAVMTHEGFHQYCHFLFNRSEAHRWFDEGHGDYYGAFKLVGSSLKPNSDMKGGLARVPIIKAMFKEGTIKPISEHIRYSHSQWQNQGPSNVSCYAQSFSLIFFLREGTRGRVSKRYWEKEYSEIIPNYIQHLSEGYTEAYANLVKETEEELKLLKESDADYNLIKNKEDIIAAPWNFLPQRTKDDIWAKAMGESWGKIDESEFEKKWLGFVEKDL
jgi:hypothetical protein